MPIHTGGARGADVIDEADPTLQPRPWIWVGNDVVDLEASRPHRYDRFVERTCTAAERRWLERSGDALRSLWSLWAAKEAAHKVLAKLGPRVFSPVRLEVAADGGSVFALDEQRHLPLFFDTGDDGLERSTFVHALCWWSESGGSGSMVPRRAVVLRDIDDESRAVREALCCAEAERLGVASQRLHVERTAEGWPRLLLDGRPSGVDVSLSHDGRFVAWASV